MATEKEFESKLAAYLTSGAATAADAAYVAYGFRNWIEEYGYGEEAEVSVWKALGYDGVVRLIPTEDD